LNHLSAFFPDPRGARLHYQYWEESTKGYDRLALILHGMDRDSGGYAASVPSFIEARRKVVALDFAGYGQSPGERGAGGVLAMADAIESLCRRLEAIEGTKDIEIVAHSMSAVAAMLFLKRYPARRVRIAAVSPLFFGLPADSGAGGADLLPSALAVDLSRVAGELLADPSFLEGRMAAFLVGEDDPLVPPERLRSSVASFPLKDSRFMRFPGEGHGSIGTRPGERAIGDMLAWFDETRLERRS
jgi:pimeloyl-ACP methyl ester carboxylesterase